MHKNPIDLIIHFRKIHVVAIFITTYAQRVVHIAHMMSFVAMLTLYMIIHWNTSSNEWVILSSLRVLDWLVMFYHSMSYHSLCSIGSWKFFLLGKYLRNSILIFLWNTHGASKIILIHYSSFAKLVNLQLLNIILYIAIII